MTESDFIVAVDGGQSQTQTVLASLDGTILASITTAPVSNKRNPHGHELVRRTLAEGYAQAFAITGFPNHQPSHVYLGLSGIDRDFDCGNLYGTNSISYSTDMLTCFAAAFPQTRSGVMVIAGTGSAVFGQREDGKNAVASGMGYYLGDEGSATWIAQKGFRAVYQANDGRAEPTALTELILQHYDCKNLTQLLDQVYGDVYSRSQLAGASKLVFLAAQKGDAVSINILEAAGNELGRAVGAVLRSLERSDAEFPIAPVGGVFSSGKLVTRPMMSTVHAVNQQARLIQAEFVPVIGAVILALEALGIEITDKIMSNLRRSQNIVGNKNEAL